MPDTDAPSNFGLAEAPGENNDAFTRDMRPSTNVEDDRGASLPDKLWRQAKFNAQDFADDVKDVVQRPFDRPTPRGMRDRSGYTFTPHPLNSEGE